MAARRKLAVFVLCSGLVAASGCSKAKPEAARSAEPSTSSLSVVVPASGGASATTTSAASTPTSSATPTSAQPVPSVVGGASGGSSGGAASSGSSGGASTGSRPAASSSGGAAVAGVVESDTPVVVEPPVAPAAGTGAAALPVVELPKDWPNVPVPANSFVVQVNNAMRKGQPARAVLMLLPDTTVAAAITGYKAVLAAQAIPVVEEGPGPAATTELVLGGGAQTPVRWVQSGADVGAAFYLPPA